MSKDGDREVAKPKQNSDVQGRMMVASRGGGIEAQHPSAYDFHQRPCRDPKFSVDGNIPERIQRATAPFYLIPERARPSTKYFWKAMNRMTTGSVMSKLIAMIRP